MHQVVTRRVQNGRWKAGIWDDDDLESDSDDEDSSSGGEDYTDGPESDSNEEESHGTLKDPASPGSSPSERRAVRVAGQQGRSHHLYFQWRGYDTMTGEVQVDPHNRNTGFLGFTNDVATTFEGKIQMDLIEGGATFQGYSIPGMSGPLLMDWGALSHLASDRAKARIHRW